jgi:hypothetical protein
MTGEGVGGTERPAVGDTERPAVGGTGVRAAATGAPTYSAPAPPGLTVAAVARRIGVAPATLRTWDRRYGLGPTAHSPGAHRRYGPHDLARLTTMRRLLLEGVSAGDAARVAAAIPDSAASDGAAADGAEANGAAANGAAADDSVKDGAPGLPRASYGGGRVVALPDAVPAVRGLAAAAISHDAATCTLTVRIALQADGLVPTWDDLVVPVLIALGERWAATGAGVDVEHLFSESVLAALRTYAASRPLRRMPRPVLLACAEEEQHALPVHALATALAELGVPTRLLGARVPREALADMVQRSGPAAVFVWSQLPETGTVEQLEAVPRLRPPVPVFVGGPGWDRAALPPRAHVVEDLRGAAAALAAAAGA